MSATARWPRCSARCRRRVHRVIFQHAFDHGSGGEASRLLSRAFAALALLALVTPAARAQGAASAERRLPEDPAIRLGTLANGLTYYIKHNGYPAHRAELRLVVNAGSVLEDEDQRGLAHLLEHMAFDGSTHFPKHGIWDYLERVGMQGGADINAATSFDQTVYRLTIPTDSAPIVANALQILEDWAHGLTLDSAEFERERQVVIEEWRLGRGAAARIRDQELPVLLHGSRYADRQPIGGKEALERGRLAAVRRFYRDWYRPDLMAVVIVGDIDPAAMEREIRRRFAAIPKATHPRPRLTYPVPPQRRPQVVSATDSEATATEVVLVARRSRVPVRTAADYRRTLVAQLWQGMLDARLTEAAQRADAPFLAAGVGSGTLVRGVGVYQIGARVSDGGVPRALDALRAEVARVRRDGFTAGELDRERAALLRSYDQLEAERERIPSGQLAEQLAEEYLTGEPTLSLDEEIALARELLPAITLNDVQRSASELLPDSDVVVLVSAPATATATLPTTTALLQQLARRAPQLAAYVDSTSGLPLLPREPAPGAVVDSARVDALGIQLWTLSNGVRVILKPTQLNPGEVLLTSYRDGGISAASDSELVPAATAVQIIGQSGLGAYDAAGLRKRLAGSVVSVGSTIGPYGEGVWGNASPKDLATLFQLVYLQFTAPRLDSAVFQQYEGALRDALTHRAASPEAAFSDTLTVILANHSPRVRLLDQRYLCELDPEKSLAFVRERFRDVTGFTFVIVGAFQPNSIKPLVERYLASLPASGEQHRWHDTGIRPPDGVVTRVVRKGKEPKGAVTLVFIGRADTSIGERTTLLALANILEQRLWDRLREQLGGVYGVTVTADQDAVPVPGYRVTVSFGADPARLEELTEVVFAEIEHLKAAGPTAVELEKFKEEYRRKRETAMRTNEYWLQSIALYDQRGWPFTDLLTGDQRVESLTTSELQAAMRRYLDPTNYVQVSLIPEDSKS